MAMGNRRNNVLGTKCSVTAKENLGVARLERPFINLRHIPLAKLNTQIALDPRESVVLTNGNEHFIGFKKDFLTGGHQTALAGLVIDHLDLIKRHAQ